MTLDEALLAHGLTLTTTRVAPGIYAWQVKYAGGGGKGRVKLPAGWAPPKGMRRVAVVERVLRYLVDTAWEVQASIENGGARPEWYTAASWKEDRAVAEQFREALPPEAFDDLISSDEGIPHKESDGKR